MAWSMNIASLMMINYKTAKLDNCNNPYPILFIDDEGSRISVDLIAPNSDHVPYSVNLSVDDARGLAKVLMDAADRIDND